MRYAGTSAEGFLDTCVPPLLFNVLEVFGEHIKWALALNGPSGFPQAVAAAVFWQGAPMDFFLTPDTRWSRLTAPA